MHYFYNSLLKHKLLLYKIFHVISLSVSSKYSLNQCLTAGSGPVLSGVVFWPATGTGVSKIRRTVPIVEDIQFESKKFITCIVVLFSHLVGSDSKKTNNQSEINQKMCRNQRMFYSWCTFFRKLSVVPTAFNPYSDNAGPAPAPNKKCQTLSLNFLKYKLHSRELVSIRDHL